MLNHASVQGLLRNGTEGYALLGPVASRVIPGMAGLDIMVGDAASSRDVSATSELEGVREGHGLQRRQITRDVEGRAVGLTRMSVDW